MTDEEFLHYKNMEQEALARKEARDKEFEEKMEVPLTGYRRYRPFRNKNEFLNAYHERIGTKQDDTLPKIFIRTMDDHEIKKWKGVCSVFF